jgi:hypothetical protein
MDFEKLYNELLPQFTAQKTQLAEFTAVAAKPADVTALKTENAALKTKVADLEAGKRKAEFSAFVETQIAAGKVLPDQKDAEVAMLETLHAATPAEFSSANGAKSPVDQYKENLGKRPKVAPETGASGARGPEFSAPIDDPVAIGMRARDYIAEQRVKGVAVDAIAAVAHVRKNG